MCELLQTDTDILELDVEVSTTRSLAPPAALGRPAGSLKLSLSPSVGGRGLASRRQRLKGVLSWGPPPDLHPQRPKPARGQRSEGGVSLKAASIVVLSEVLLFRSAK